MYLLGTYFHTLDAKNRLIVPAKFIPVLKKEIVVNKGFDGCLELRTASEFEKFTNQLMSYSNNKKDTRILTRQLLANAADLEIDSAKRILIPQVLLAEVGITKEVAIIGVGSKIEIWDKAKYLEFKKATDSIYESIAEKIDGDNHE